MKVVERPPGLLPEGMPRRPKGDKVEVVEYRDAKRGYAARLVLRVRAGDPQQAEAGDVRNLRVTRSDGMGVYQVTFSRGQAPADEMLPDRSTTHCHEFPIASLVRCEEEWAPGHAPGFDSE